MQRLPGLTPCDDSVCLNQTYKECSYPNCIGRTVFWYRNFTYSDQGTWFYKFMLNTNQTSGNEIITVEKDDISIIRTSPSLDYIVNRSSSQNVNLIVFVNDTDAAHAAGNITAGYPYATVYFNTTNASQNYITYGSNLTNDTGYSAVTFNPDCNYTLGLQNWTAFTSGDLNYKNYNSSINNISIYGDLVPQDARTFNTSGESDMFYRGNMINITGRVLDDCGNAIANTTGVNITIRIYKNSTYPSDPTDYCANVTYLGNATYNCLWNSTGLDNGTYSIRMNASNVNLNNNGTYLKSSAFGLGVPPNSPPTLSNPAVNPNPGGWGSTFNFSINVSDPNENQVITVYFWTNETGSWVLKENKTCSVSCNAGSTATLYFNKSDYACGQKGTQFYKFNASDNSYSITNLSDSLDNQQFTMIGDNIGFVNPVGNGSTVNRSGNQNVFLAIQINDTTKGVLVQ